jgi:hypothetical protein
MGHGDICQLLKSVVQKYGWAINRSTHIYAYKEEEPIPDTLRFRTTKESELDMKKK